jgi:DNA modification methylase
MSLQITQVKISKLKPAIYNPRKWPDQSEKNLTESIKRFGLVDPIIVNSAPNRKNVVIGGHFRLRVAKKLGFSRVPVVYLHIPDEDKEKELNLRLNQNTGEWNFDLLKEFDIGLLLEAGFNDSDLSLIWDRQLSIEDDKFDLKKSLEDHKKPKSKIGDFYQLGDHFLLCGDATDSNVVQKLLNNTKVNMIYCDPPYNISLNYSDGVSTKGKYGGSKTNDNKSAKDYRDFIKQTLKSALLVALDDVHIFYWCDENWIGLLQQLYQELSIKHQRVCFWVKNNINPTPQVAFNKVYEPCVYGTIGNPYLDKKMTNLNEVLNKEVTTGNRLSDDILDLFSIWLVKRKAGQDYLHPTEKPITLHEKPLRRCTKPNDVILDLFGGSGSTLIACEQMKRKAFLAEIDPVFCDVIIDRWQQLTGKEATCVN